MAEDTPLRPGIKGPALRRSQRRKRGAIALVAAGVLGTVAVAEYKNRQPETGLGNDNSQEAFADANTFTYVQENPLVGARAARDNVIAEYIIDEIKSLIVNMVEFQKTQGRSDVDLDITAQVNYLKKLCEGEEGVKRIVSDYLSTLKKINVPSDISSNENDVAENQAQILSDLFAEMNKRQDGSLIIMSSDEQYVIAEHIRNSALKFDSAFSDGTQPRFSFGASWAAEKFLQLRGTSPAMTWRNEQLKLLEKTPPERSYIKRALTRLEISENTAVTNYLKEAIKNVAALAMIDKLNNLDSTHEYHADPVWLTNFRKAVAGQNTKTQQEINDFLADIPHFINNGSNIGIGILQEVNDLTLSDLMPIQPCSIAWKGRTPAEQAIIKDATLKAFAEIAQALGLKPESPEKDTASPGAVSRLERSQEPSASASR